MGKTKELASTGSVLQRGDDHKELKLKFVLPSKRVKKEDGEYTSGVDVSPTKASPHQVLSDDSISADDFSNDSDSSKDSSDGTSWEDCLIGQQHLALPLSLIQQEDLSCIFNMDVWNNVLSPEDRTKLGTLLPASDTEAQQLETLTKLFNGDTFHFSNPILKTARALQEGEFQEEIARKREQLRYANYVQYIRDLRSYHFKMVDDIIHYRRKLFKMEDTAQISAYINKKKVTEAVTSPILPEAQEKPRVAETVMPSKPTTTTSTPILPSQQALPTPVLPTTSTLPTLPPAAATTTVTAPTPAPPLMEPVEAEAPKKGKRKQPATTEAAKKPKAAKRAKATKTGDDEVKVTKRRKEKVAKVDTDIIKNEVPSPKKAEQDLDSSPPPNAVPAFLLFFTIRDYFEANTYSAPLNDIVKQVETVNLLVAHMPPFFELPEFVKLALLFLAKPPVLSSAAQNSQQPGGGSGTGITYEEPIVRYDKASQRWHWLDIGRVRLNGPVGDEHLQSLEQLFYFATARNMTSPIDNSVDLSITMNRQQKCILTIEQSSEEMVESFQQQEAERYKVPEKPFVYTIKDLKYVVAPMKRGVGNPGNKPREHFLLKTDRPPHINLLCLVRDAAARLPGGVGTRPDVSLLLRDSQYVVESSTDQQINTVVSGALDRLHSEKDPCVKFDSEQKLWVYLHRHRTEADFSSAKARGKRGGRKKEKEKEKEKDNDQPSTPTTGSAATTPVLPAKHLTSPSTPSSPQQRRNLDPPLVLEPTHAQSLSPQITTTTFTTSPHQKSISQLQALRQQLSPQPSPPQSIRVQPPLNHTQITTTITTPRLQHQTPFQTQQTIQIHQSLQQQQQQPQHNNPPLPQQLSQKIQAQQLTHSA